MFRYSDTWQLVINTATTIITFLMVFLIQNTQNRDSLALQVKLAELIIAMKGAENKMATVEDLSEEELRSFTRIFARAPKQPAMFSMFAVSRASRLPEGQEAILFCRLHPPMGKPRIPWPNRDLCCRSCQDSTKK